MLSSRALSKAPSASRPDATRAYVHDLRNLFAVVASAKSLLERPLDEAQRRLVMDGLARVAVEGKIVTDGLLGRGRDASVAGSEVFAELRDLAPVIKTLEQPWRRIELVMDGSSSWVLMAPEEFRAVVLELVTNASTAGARQIRLRACRRGSRLWLLVADDGSGFAPGELTPATSPSAGVHGTGMRRLAAAVGAAHGTIRIKSNPGAGTIVAMILPVMRVADAHGSTRFPADDCPGAA